MNCADPVDTLARPWNFQAVAHLPKAERQQAYFAWYKRMKRHCRALGIPAPTRPKRSKAETEAEKLVRIHEANRRSRAKSVEKNRKRSRQWYLANREAEIAKSISYNATHPEVYAAGKRRYRVRLKERGRTDEQRAKTAAYQRTRRANDYAYRIKCNLGNRLSVCLRLYGRGAKKVGGSISAVVGCSLDELVVYLESRFDDGMNWQNYGSAWHIDHIRPCASFDLSDKTQQMACFHFSNLQPLWASFNMRKGASLLWCAQEEECHDLA